MKPEELKDIMEYLRNRVGLGPLGAEETTIIKFQPPTEEEMLAAGLDTKGVKRILGVPWWDEMVEDIIDTPDMCDADDPPEQVLEYAKDVISEYIRKRFPLNPDQE